MNFLVKKIFIFSIIFVMLFNLTGFVESPPKAQAQWTVTCTDCAKVWNQITGIAKDIAFYVDTANKWLVDKLNLNLTDLIAKRIIDYIVDQTVVWIQGGGKPKFVSDWNGLLKTAGDIAFDTVVKEVGAARICEPFSFNVRVSLIPIPKLSTQIDCTLDKVVSNIRNFYRDFRQGGWLAYEETWAPNNNFYAVQLQIADQIMLESARKARAAQNEALASKGFVGVKRCVEWNIEGYQQCVASGQNTEAECKQASCIKEEITTPGSAVGTAVENAIGADTQWAANIRSWTALLIDALINRLTKEGLSAMKSALSGGGASGNAASAYMPSGYQGLVSQELESNKQQMTSELRKFRDEKQYVLNAKYKSLSFADRTLVTFQAMKTRNCAVSDSEIQTVQADDARLKTETADLEKSVKELTTAINKVSQAVSITALSSLNQETLQVFNKYNSAGIQEQIITGSARQAADKETQDKQAALSNAESRLNSCVPSATTSTQP